MHMSHKVAEMQNVTGELCAHKSSYYDQSSNKTKCVQTIRKRSWLFVQAWFCTHRLTVAAEISMEKWNNDTVISLESENKRHRREE